MAFKAFQLAELGTVTVYKRRGAHSVRLSIRPDGSVRVTVPAWSTYATGVKFAQSRATWIRKHSSSQALIRDGQHIGKAHSVSFVSSASATRPLGRVRQIKVVVTHPGSLAFDAPEVQTAATKACIRALKAQAEKLLPGRLENLAAIHRFSYSSVTVKNLKTRWGSCDQDKNITLNLYLMQLPWELIDYVLLHELTHTNILKHGPTFWQAMESLEPKTQMLRASMHRHRPVLSDI